MRLLLVEDTDDVAEAVVNRFQRDGHVVDRVIGRADGWEAIHNFRYDLVILDANLPDGSGFDLLAECRKAGRGEPILMLTARSQVEDRVNALDLGADDYLVKPFDLRELSARANAVVRRHQGKTDNEMVLGGLRWNRAERRVVFEGRPLDLTRREFLLFEILAAAPGRLFSKAELLDRLFEMQAEPGENAVELYVGRLRRKLAGTGFGITTLRGLGYRGDIHG